VEKSRDFVDEESSMCAVWIRLGRLSIVVGYGVIVGKRPSSSASLGRAR
jgi:hypothetical protein